ncbi:MAG: hypothetical protein IPN44_13120 [Flavobacteriales bacterium]|nr:hypothetical protein [Flavobacteriales bacterium]
MKTVKQTVDELIALMEANPSAVDKAWAEAGELGFDGPSLNDLTFDYVTPFLSTVMLSNVQVMAQIEFPTDGGGFFDPQMNSWFETLKESKPKEMISKDVAGENPPQSFYAYVHTPLMICVS